MTTEKIKQIEKEIEDMKREQSKIRGGNFLNDEIKLFEAQLQTLKECQAEEKRKVDELKKGIDEWNYLGTAREPISYGKRMRFKDTNKKVYKVGRRRLKELKEIVEKIFSEGK